MAPSTRISDSRCGSAHTTLPAANNPITIAATASKGSNFTLSSSSPAAHDGVLLDSDDTGAITIAGTCGGVLPKDALAPPERRGFTTTKTRKKARFKTTAPYEDTPWRG